LPVTPASLLESECLGRLLVTLLQLGEGARKDAIKKGLQGRTRPLDPDPTGPGRLFIADGT
jgi:hypothetical protein